MGYGGKKRRRQEEVIPVHTTGLWHLLCLCVIVGAALAVAAMILSSWRCGAAIQYRYIFRSAEKRISVSETEYGLHTIVYDGGSAYLTWAQRVEEIQTRGSAAIQLGQQTSSNAQFQAWAAQCPPQCQDAISTRLSCYKRISTISTILLGALALGGAVGLIGVSWFYIFGKLAFLQMGCWLVGGALCYGVLGYWIWETDTCWRMIVATQQYPYPAVGLPWYIALFSSGLYVAAGLGSIVADYIDTYNERKMKEEAQMRLMMEAGDAFESFMGPPAPPGLHPGFMGAGLGAGAMMRPPMGPGMPRMSHSGAPGMPPPGAPGMPPPGAPVMPGRPMMMAGPPGHMLMPGSPALAGAGAPAAMMGGGMMRPPGVGPPGGFPRGPPSPRMPGPPGMMYPPRPSMMGPPPGAGFPNRPRPF